MIDHKLKVELLKYLEEIDERIPKVPKGRKYWMIRSGEKSRHFYEFTSNEYVAIPWEKLNNLKLLKGKTTEEIKNLLSIEYEYKPQPLSTATNKIFRFINEIKVGDIIVMPAARLQKVAIGIVESDVYIENCLSQQTIPEVDGKVNKMDLGCYNKRRKVSWVSYTLGEDIIDKNLINVLYNIHGIVEIPNKEIQDIVEGMINPFYIKKNGEGSMTLSINSKNKIKDKDLSPITTEITNIMEFISQILLEQENDVYTKHSFSSPGTVKYLGGPAILAITVMIVAQLTSGTKEIELRNGIKIKTSSEKNLIDTIIDGYHRWKMNGVEYDKARYEFERKKIRESAETIELKVPKI